MIGETIIGRRGNRNAWLAWMLAGAFMVAGDFAMNEHHFLILSLAPFAVGLAVAMTRRDPLIVHFQEEGIEVLSPALEFIPYESIEALTVGNERGRQFSFSVLHRNGALNFPTDIDFESREVFRFLRGELPEDESIGPPPSLHRFMRSQDEEFGENRVFAYRSLAGPRFDQGFMGVFVSLALFAVAVIWIIVGAADQRYSAWAGVGVLLCLGSAIGFIICAVNRRPSSTSAGDGGIVISPAGIAVEQGNLRGQMRWNEVTDIELNRMTYSLRIRFHGGLLTLRDVYHRSLRLIHRRLQDYWEGPLDDY